MKNGILKETDGWDIVVNGVNRAFRDIEQIAIDSAKCGKSMNLKDHIHVRCRADGSLCKIMPDLSVKAVNSLTD